ncbi:MAG: ATP-grasp domain-containing protein [Polyangiaceae bacterium]|nr:ATP-grasp domain-containing protein [Polyangiaceae bacterium]
MTRVAIVGCGFPQVGLLKAARALGLHVIGLDKNLEAVGAPLASELLEVSTGDADAVAEAVRATGARAIATTGSELALTTTTAVAARLGLPFYATPEVVHRCQAKDAMRAAYEAAGLPVPRFAAASTLARAERFVAEVGLPVVVKPARGWGQRGVSRVERADLLPRAFAEAAAISHGGAGVVLEEVIVGREVSVNGWVTDGALEVFSVTDREVFAGDRPLGVMRSEVCPSERTDDEVARAIDAATRAQRALGLTRGPCYTQVCVTSNGAVVFETAARCGGGFDADVTRLVSGVDLYRRTLGVALGDAALEREGAAHERHAAALVRFLAPPEGVARSVEGVEAARACDGVVDAALYPRPGQRLHGLVNAASRMGHLLVVGASRAQAVLRADAAERCLRVEV